MSFVFKKINQVLNMEIKNSKPFFKIDDTKNSFGLISQINQGIKKDKTASHLTIFVGLGLITAFLTLVSLAPQIGERLGTLSVKKHKQQVLASGTTTSSRFEENTSGQAATQPSSAQTAPQNFMVNTVEVQNFLDLLNAYRRQQQPPIGPLTPSLILSNAAQWMANDMATNNYAGHTDSLGRTWSQRLDAFGYTNWNRRGETLGAGYETAQALLDGFIGSPDHNTIQLMPEFTAVGISRAFKAGTAYGWYWTMDFGDIIDTPVIYTVPTPTPTPTPTATSAIGDVNCDGKVDSVDALNILRYVAGLTPGNETSCVQGQIFLPAARVDNDSDVDSVDALYVLQIAAHLRDATTLQLIASSTDTDGDGMTDQQENAYPCLNKLVVDAQADPDNDSVTVPTGSIRWDNAAELAGGTNPCLADTDRDGFNDGVEVYLDTDPLKACITSNDDIDFSKPNNPSKVWPADLVTGTLSLNKIDVYDISSFIAPVRRLNTSPGMPGYDKRWDLVPGKGFSSYDINITDLSYLITFAAPMLSNYPARAYGGPACTP